MNLTVDKDAIVRDIPHVLRNCLAPVIVAVTLNIGGMITVLGFNLLGDGCWATACATRWTRACEDGRSKGRLVTQLEAVSEGR